VGRDAIGMLVPEAAGGVGWDGNRGAITLDVAVKGRAAHVGLQRLGVNAFERAVTIVEKLFALKRDIDRKSSILLVGGRVEAGTGFNVVPAECRFSIDRRINPTEDFDAD